MSSVDVEAVREVIRAVLRQAPPFGGRAELLAQVASVGVAGGSPTMLKLVVDGSLSPAPLPSGPVPGTCSVTGSAGTPLGTVIVWTDRGHLDALEVGWVTDTPPTGLPDPSALRTESNDDDEAYFSTGEPWEAEQ